MNYVAHLFLAKPSDEHRIGSLLADFTVGTLDLLRTRYSDKIVEGIEHHRAVDHFTDTHVEVSRAIEALKDRFGLYASIIVDVVYDHFLLKHWHCFTEISTDQFFDAVYRSLARRDWTYPKRYIQVIDRLIERRWLASYIDIDTVSFALKRVGMRFSKPTPLDDTFDGIQDNYSLLNDTFLAFFPDLLAFSRTITEPTGQSVGETRGSHRSPTC
jgi:acyl carrier protein phosphodiesterase